jgi:hypothetical protein
MSGEPSDDFWSRYWWPLVAFIVVFSLTTAFFS